jgi:hypothetical protein
MVQAISEDFWIEFKFLGQDPKTDSIIHMSKKSLLTAFTGGRVTVCNRPPMPDS